MKSSDAVTDRWTVVWASIYCLLTLAVIGFQLALAAGAPWGELAMAGQFPGRLPPAMRVAAVVQAALLSFLMLVVLARAGLALKRPSRLAGKAIWAVVAFSLLALFLNLITPSPRERRLWAPVALGLSVASLGVALRRPTGTKEPIDPR